MATLTASQKRFIVTALARFKSVPEVRALVKDEFGLELSRQQVHYYDPSSRTGGFPADRWKELHQQVRDAYVENVAAVDVAHERFRLEQLSRILRKLLKAGDHTTALKVLKQAAQERGNAFTNVRDVQSRGERVDPPDIFVYGGEPPNKAAK